MSPLSSVSTSQEIAKRFGSIVNLREPHGLEASIATIIAEPGNVDEISELVRACTVERMELTAFGAGRTLANIRRIPTPIGVSLRRLDQIVEYDPADMTVTVQGGVSLGELNRTLAASRQRLPIDPTDPENVTMGALIAASHSGPLRLSEGTIRDLLIGVRYVGSGGRKVHGGGRVVKNVAGYDLMKVMTGSFGTLGIITEATFKVRPLPEHFELCIAEYENLNTAFEVARQFHDVTAPAHLEVISPAAARACELGSNFTVLAGISGNDSETIAQRGAIEKIAADARSFEGEDALKAYSRLRDFNMRDATLVARIATPLAEMKTALSKVDADFVAHVGSGVAEIFVNRPISDARNLIDGWREALHGLRGHLRVIRCEPALQSQIEFFDLPNEGSLELMRRLKAAFDPERIFNPGCFVGGI